jgi:hypothetical protein
MPPKNAVLPKSLDVLPPVVRVMSRMSAPVAVFTRCSFAGFALSTIHTCPGLLGSIATSRRKPWAGSISFNIIGADVPPAVVTVILPKPCTGSVRSTNVLSEPLTLFCTSGPALLAVSEVVPPAKL